MLRGFEAYTLSCRADCGQYMWYIVQLHLLIDLIAEYVIIIVFSVTYCDVTPLFDFLDTESTSVILIHSIIAPFYTFQC